MDYSSKSIVELIEMVEELDNVCEVLMKYNCWSSVDDVNELCGEIRMELMDRES